MICHSGRVLEIRGNEMATRPCIILYNIQRASALLWSKDLLSYIFTGWLGWAMVLGSFQCRGVLLLLHLVGQGPAVLAAGVGRVGYSPRAPSPSSLSNFLMSCLLRDG